MTKEQPQEYERFDVIYDVVLKSFIENQCYTKEYSNGWYITSIVPDGKDWIVRWRKKTMNL